MNPRRNFFSPAITSFLTAAFFASAAEAQDAVPAPPPPTPKPAAAEEAKCAAARKDEKTNCEALTKQTQERIKAADAEFATKKLDAEKEAKAKIAAARKEAEVKKAAARTGEPEPVFEEKAPIAPPPTNAPGAEPANVPTSARVPAQKKTLIQINSADMAKVCATLKDDPACSTLRKGQDVRAERGRALRTMSALCSATNTEKVANSEKVPNVDKLTWTNDDALTKAYDRVCGKPLGFTKVYAEFLTIPGASQVQEMAIADAKAQHRPRPDACAVWDSAKTKDNPPLDQRAIANVSSAFERGCSNKAEHVSGLALPVEFLATTVLQGTGDFLKTRAKHELVAYAVDQLGGRACKEDGKVRKFLTFDKERFVFDGTCTTAFGASAEGVLDYQAFTDGRFQRAFEKELPDVPITLLRAVERASRKNNKAGVMDPTQAKVWIEIAHGLFSAMLELRKTGSAPLDVLKKLDATVTERLKEEQFSPGSPAFSCSVGKDKDGKDTANTAACSTLFALRAGSSIKALDGTVQIAGTLDEAKVSFCTDYGFGDGTKDGACVTVEQLDRAAAWLDEAIAVLNDLIDVENARKTLVAEGATPLEVTKKIAPDYAKDVERLLRATVDVARSTGASKPTLDWLTALASASGAVGAIIGLDYPAAAANLKAVLALDSVHQAVVDELGPNSTRALSFLLSLGSAKDADGVKQVLEEQAEPLGSYRQKYTDDFVLSLNGFVGPAGGITHRYSVNNGASANVAEFKPLSALIGLDFSFRWDKQHLGFMVTALDALGAGTVNKEDGGDIDWGGVVVPGLLLRWGIQKSPIVFYASGQWQPLRKSEASTAGINDWKGATSLYAGFAVDVPILTLH